MFSKINPFVLMAMAFCFVWAIGTYLLMQPWATQASVQTPFIDAFFTAASALFVTGLAVVETGTYWSFLGQVVLLLLIQVGAVGVITIGSYMVYLIGHRLFYADRSMLSDNLGFEDKGKALEVLPKIIKYVFIIEICGALLLSVNFFLHGYSTFDSIWFGVFHAISAFANAGFDILGLGTSAQALVEIGIALEIIMALIVIGGLGFPVWIDCLEKLRSNSLHQISLHSRVVIIMNILFIIMGASAFWFFEKDTRMVIVDDAQHIRESLFHSISARTAGFSVFDLTQKSNHSLIVLMSLMFIGGSPASTAGGIKVTAALIIILLVVSVLRGNLRINLFRRHIPTNMLLRVVSLATLSLMLVVFATIAIEFFDNKSFMSVLFETVSAMGTVGLSLNLTSQLSTASKLVIIGLMFMGRVGLYVLMYGFIFHKKKRLIVKKYPEAEVCL